MSETVNVWVLRIEHRHGADVVVFATEEAALNSLWMYVQTWWAEEMCRYELVPMPEDRGAAIDAYFEEMSGKLGREFYELTEQEVYS